MTKQMLYDYYIELLTKQFFINQTKAKEAFELIKGYPDEATPQEQVIKNGM